MQFPIFTIAGRIYTNPTSEGMALEIPMMVLVMEGGGEIGLNIPMFTAVIEAHIDPVASIALISPRMTLEAIALTSGSGIFSKTIPMFSLVAAASQNGIMFLEENIPMMLLSASATAGYVASLEKSYPAFQLSATAYWTAAATLAADLPMWELSAFARTTKVGLCFNPRNMAFSNYASFDYKGVAYFNGNPIAITRTGLFELSGDLDNTTAIEWKLRSGKVDVSHNHLRQVWVTGKFGTTFTVTIEDIEGNRYSYDAVPWSDDMNEVRVKLGKNIRSRYVIFELTGDSAAEIDRIRFFGVRGEMKR